MHYKRLLTLIDSISSYLSVGLDIGADFTWMSIALPSNAVRIRLYIDIYLEYQKHLDALLNSLHETVDNLQDTVIYGQLALLQSLHKCICPSGVPALPGASCTWPHSIM